MELWEPRAKAKVLISEVPFGRYPGSGAWSVDSDYASAWKLDPPPKSFLWTAQGWCWEGAEGNTAKGFPKSAEDKERVFPCQVRDCKFFGTSLNTSSRHLRVVHTQNALVCVFCGSLAVYDLRIFQKHTCPCGPRRGLKPGENIDLALVRREKEREQEAEKAEKAAKKKAAKKVKGRAGAEVPATGADAGAAAGAGAEEVVEIDSSSEQEDE